MNLFDEYPEFKNKKGIEIQRYKIAPIGVGSQHDGGSLTITKDAADIFSKQIEHTPLLYAECDTKLPNKHNDKYNKRKVIGSGLKGFVAKENGIDWLMGDYAIYTDTEPDIVEKIKKFKNDVSASYELRQSLIDNDGNIIDGEYEATSVVGKDYSAYRHHALLVADKTGMGDKTDIEVKYDDIIKEIIGNDYNKKLQDKDNEIESLKSQIEKVRKDNEIELDNLKQEANTLREVANSFSKLVN